MLPADAADSSKVWLMAAAPAPPNPLHTTTWPTSGVGEYAPATTIGVAFDADVVSIAFNLVPAAADRSVLPAAAAVEPSPTANCALVVLQGVARPAVDRPVH